MSSVIDDNPFDELPLQPPASPAPPAPPALPALPAPPAPPAPPAAVAATPELRAFGDPSATRRLIYDNVLKAAQGFQPLANQRYTLALQDVHYADPDEDSIARRKRAILTGDTLGRRLRGTWVLQDNATGQPVAKKKTLLATIPHMTAGGTFVLRGNEYTMANQLRLRPGVFTRVKENGELEAHVNVLPGKGVSHRLFLDPTSGVFRIQLGQAQIPLLPVLRAMGVTDSQLREVWGNDLTAVNMEKNDPKAIGKLYAKLARYGDPNVSEEQKRQAIAAAFEKMELDPDVTQQTLKFPAARVNAETLLATTKKLLAVSRGEDEPDERDHLAFQTIHGPEDIIAERLARAQSVARRLLWKATARGNLDHVTAGTFDETIRSAIIGSGLAQANEEINPAELLDAQGRVTRMGVGGIPSLDAVPEDSRAVQPSQFGFIDFLRTAESEKAGVDMRIARGARKGRDGRMYIQVRDREGRLVWKSAQDLATATMAFPGELGRANGDGANRRPTTTHVAAISSGRLRMVPREEVTYEIPTMEDTFSPLGNMIPMKSMVKGQRAVMAARMLTQALPLIGAEAPLVQSGMPGETDRSFEEEYASHLGAVRASQPGRVVNVADGKLTVQYADGKREDLELYENFPYARKTFVHQTPVVKPGDTFQAGQLLARSNFTDDRGTAALGRNLRVAYLPFRGLNFEDANVISESAAKKLTSEHMYQHGVEWEPTHKRGRNAFVSLFPAVYNRKTLENFDEHGVIRPGTTVRKGDPLVLVARERERDHKSVHRGRSASFANETVTWDHPHPGVVTDVVPTDKRVVVVVRSQAPMEVGDKLSGRYGDKGLIAAIVPDDEMPRDATGRPYEALINPLGIISRVNPAQIVETALGKIAEKTGKPYKLKDFDQIDDAVEFAMAELRKHGLTDLEDVEDAATGRKIRNVLTGNRFFMKLKQTADDYGQGRGLGGYTADETPAKGGKEGSKKIGMLELNSILSHGGVEVLRDAKLVRGQANPDWWRQFMSGHKPPTPRVPRVYEKFVHDLKAAGINVVREGARTHIMALTDRDIDTLAEARELRNVETVDWRQGLKPIAGGLFDEALTGGHNGNRWAKITLHEPLPNPVMEEPIRWVLGLTKQQLEDVIAGKRELRGMTGPRAIQQALATMNLDREIAQAAAEFHGAKKSKRDAAARRWGYLKDAKRVGIHPRDWVLSAVPVLPPAFRPISVIGGSNGMPLVADPNYLYKEVFEANRLLKQMSEQLGEDVGDERLALYNAFRGVTGLGDPIHPKNRERKVKGILRHVFSSSPKLGTVQQRLLGTTTDVVGRAVISPNPDLDMDQVGLPEDRAWDVYRPFVVRHLVRRGVPRLQAARAVEERSSLAREALLAEMEARPVVINRAPTLHRYGVMAFWPTITKHNVLQVSPLIVKGFGADFNGDSCRTPLLPVLVRGKLFLGDFETFMQEYVMPSYSEATAIATLGRQTTMLEFDPAADVRVPGVGTDGRVGWNRVAYISVHTSHGPDCFRVRTEKGMDTVFTAHHNFVTLDDACCLVPTKTDGIKAGSLLPVVFGVAADSKDVRAPGKPGLRLGFKAGFFLGHYLGDGSLTGREDTVSQASTDSSLLTYLEQAGKQFSAVSPWREGNGKSTRWTDKELFRWLASTFGRGFADKHVPGWCIEAPRSFREGLLLGFLVAEGSSTGSVFRAEVANRKLLLGIQMVAFTLGISSQIRPAKPLRKSKKTDATLAATFRINVNAASFVKQIRHWPTLTCILPFRQYRAKGDHQVWDMVPYPKCVADRVNAVARSFVGGKGRWATAIGKRTGAHRTGQFVSAKDRKKSAARGSCTRAMARKLISHYQLSEQADPVLTRWIALVENEQLIWDVVEAVERTARPDVTYDFHVPGGETFCIDGFFLTHNSMQYHVPVSDEAAKEAAEKMLPSQNLLNVANFKVLHQPANEYTGGLYEASARVDTKNKPRVFATVAEAIRAYKRGEIDVDRRVEILDPT